jgi:hypothetical protein
MHGEMIMGFFDKLIEAYERLYKPELKHSRVADALMSMYNPPQDRINDKILGLCVLRALNAFLGKASPDSVKIFGVLHTDDELYSLLKGYNYQQIHSGSRLHGIEIKVGDVHIAMDLGGLRGMKLGKEDSNRASAFREYSFSTTSSSARGFTEKSNHFVICLASSMYKGESNLTYKLCNSQMPVELQGQEGACRGFRERVCQETLRLLSLYELRFTSGDGLTDTTKVSYTKFDLATLAEKVRKQITVFAVPGYSDSSAGVSLYRDTVRPDEDEGCCCFAGIAALFGGGRRQAQAGADPTSKSHLLGKGGSSA